MKTMEIITALLGILFIGSMVYFGPDIHKHLGSRYEEARHDIYSESTTHINGTIQHLNRLKLEYTISNNPAHRMALKQAALTTLGSIDENQLPLSLRRWIIELRSETF